MSEPPRAIVFTRRAAREVEEAAEWWRQNREVSPEAVAEDLRQALNLLVTQPGMGVRIANARLTGLRRIYLKRIGYFVYYRARPRLRRLEVAAFWHARRGSGPVL